MLFIIGLIILLFFVIYLVEEKMVARAAIKERREHLELAMDLARKHGEEYSALDNERSKDRMVRELVAKHGIDAYAPRYRGDHDIDLKKDISWALDRYEYLRGLTYPTENEVRERKKFGLY